MSNYPNRGEIQAAIERERKKTTLGEIYRQKFRNLNPDGSRKPTVHKVKVNYAKKPRQRRSTSIDNEIFYTATEYANVPKTDHIMPERRLDETFEEYYARIRSGI